MISTVTLLGDDFSSGCIVEGTPNEGASKLPFMVEVREGTPAWFLDEKDAVTYADWHAVATVWRRKDGGWTLHPAHGFNGRLGR